MCVKHHFATLEMGFFVIQFRKVRLFINIKLQKKNMLFQTTMKCMRKSIPLQFSNFSNDTV